MQVIYSTLGPEGLGDINNVDEDMEWEDVQSNEKDTDFRRQQQSFNVIGDGIAISEEQQLGDIRLSILSMICSVVEQALPSTNITIISNINTVHNSITNKSTFSSTILIPVGNTLLSLLTEHCVTVKKTEGAAHFLFIINTFQFAATAQQYLSSLLLYLFLLTIQF